MISDFLNLWKNALTGALTYLQMWSVLLTNISHFKLERTLSVNNMSSSSAAAAPPPPLLLLLIIFIIIIFIY